MPHPGIINLDDFNTHFDLRCYEPSDELKPFVVHIWTQRLRHLHNLPPKPPTEIMSGSNIYLFFTPETAFIHGVVPSAFQYDAFTPGVITGVKFRPGGFFPFFERPLSQLTTDTPLESLFPDATTAFRKKLLQQTDEGIVAMLEMLLLNKEPKEYKNLKSIAAILEMLDETASPKTVSEIAQAFGMSERSLQFLFYTHVGAGLKWILARQRLLGAINRAQRQPLLSWTEIAAELNYSSQSHFSREFKKAIGQSPSHYLKGLKLPDSDRRAYSSQL